MTDDRMSVPSDDALTDQICELLTASTRPCDNEREPDGEPCTGVLTYEPDDVQAKCPTCGGWSGRLAPIFREVP